MHKLATALLHTAAFLELSGDDVIDPDSVVKAMEDLVVDLQGCTMEERSALQEAIANEVKILKKAKASEETIEFYEEFFENFGLSEDEE